MITVQEDRQSEARAIFREFLQARGLPVYRMDAVARAIREASDNGVIIELAPDARQMLCDVLGSEDRCELCGHKLFPDGGCTNSECRNF